MPPINLTPKRIALLRLLALRGEFYVSGLADKIAPRISSTGREYGWSRQGAARWGGAYVRPLEKAGLITVNRHVDCGVGIAHLTEVGRRLLREHDAQAQRLQDAASLEDAIERGV